MQINYRFLSSSDFAELHATFLEAFSDYVVPFQLSVAQLENHIAQNAVDLTRSVGAFAAEKMVGCTLNGFGVWNGKETVYDAGTGVIPAFRNRGVAAKMFEFMLPVFKTNGVEQVLLEVITKNERAFRLYRKIGFRQTRELLFFAQEKPFEFISAKAKIEVREITTAPDWALLRSFWDAETSWQNSVEALERNLTRKIILGAFCEGNCIGYGAFLPNSAIIAQIAVDKKYRRSGVGSRILSEIQKVAEKGKFLRVTNVESSLKNVAEFLKKRNFDNTLSQWEMIKVL